MSARAKIHAAAAATKRMDDLLDPAIDDLRAAIRDGNGAGIYYDVSRVRSALAHASIAITKAVEIADATSWPTAEEYDAS